jgi:hypothetical protein
LSGDINPDDLGLKDHIVADEALSGKPRLPAM